MGMPVNEQTIRPGERSIDSVQATRRELFPVVITAADGNLKASAGYLGNLNIHNGGGAATTVTLVNASSGTTPAVALFAVAAGTTLNLPSLDWFFDAAIRVSASSWTSVTVTGGVA